MLAKTVTLQAGICLEVCDQWGVEPQCEGRCHGYRGALEDEMTVDRAIRIGDPACKALMKDTRP